MIEKCELKTLLYLQELPTGGTILRAYACGLFHFNFSMNWDIFRDVRAMSSNLLKLELLNLFDLLFCSQFEYIRKGPRSGKKMSSYEKYWVWWSKFMKSGFKKIQFWGVLIIHRTVSPKFQTLHLIAFCAQIYTVKNIAFQRGVCFIL